MEFTFELIVGIIVSIVVGICSGGLGAYVAVKVLANEIKWMNRILDKHDVEIDRLHSRVNNHVTNYHSNEPAA